jgi:hypothetical protein
MRVRGLTLLLTPWLFACHFSSAPTVTPDAITPLSPKIARSALLLLPDDFANYVQQGSQNGYEFHFTVGPGAAAAITDLIRGSFDRVIVRQVQSGTAALLAATAAPSDSLQPDYIILPSFGGGGGTFVRTGQGAGLEVHLQLDAISRDHARTISLRSEGRGSSALGLGKAVADAGSRALSRAVSALRDSLDTHRTAF